MKRLFTILSLMATSILGAQTASDALRFSDLGIGGTARTIGIGGAIGAFGADFSCLSTNPAGLAAFRRGDFSFTPALVSSKTNATLSGEGNVSFDDTKTNFHFQNIGMVFSRPSRNPKWRTFNFGIGYNRLANFANRSFYDGSTQGSITDRFLEQATSVGLDEFESDLAFQTGALYEDDGKYVTDYSLSQGAFLRKKQSINTSGSVGELAIALGGNYDEKLMVGGTIGIPFIKYKETKNYTEIDELEETPYFNTLRFNENLDISGAGINLKLGFIYIPIRPVRIGLAVHTPSYFALTDAFKNSMTYDYTLDNSPNNSITQESPDGSFSYTLKTPWRTMGNVGVLLGQHGFIAADVEYVDYRVASFSTNSTANNSQEYFREVNDTISVRYKNALNYRVGAEIVKDKLRFRAGVGLAGAPYDNDNSFNMYYTAGIGIREKSFYIDLAYRLAQSQDGYRPYEVGYGYFKQKVTNKINSNLFALTIGFKFGE